MVKHIIKGKKIIACISNTSFKVMNFAKKMLFIYIDLLGCNNSEKNSIK
jgi:hypothetical protein